MSNGEDTPLARARSFALRLLAARPRTTSQIRERLARAGHAPELVEDLVRWLARLGYLDDASYALARARSLVALGRAGPRLAERKLVAAGIAPREAAAAVEASVRELSAERPGGETRPVEPAEVALCRKAALRRSRGSEPAILEAREKARLGRYLLGRGFSGHAVSRVLGIHVDLE